MAVEEATGGGVTPNPVAVNQQPLTASEESKEPASTTSDERKSLSQGKDYGFASSCWRWITWTPKRCRWDPDSPPTFSLFLNLLFGFVSDTQYVF